MIAILWTLLVAFTANAQKGTHFAIKVIPQNVYMFNREDTENPNFIYNSKWKVAAAVSFDYHFLEKLGLGMDVLYSPQGLHHKDYNGFVYGYNVSYIKLPISLNFNSDPERTVMGYFQAGPQLAFRARAELNYGKADLDYGEADETIDVKDLFRKVNFGVVLGCGIAFNLPGNVVISTGMRADLGLTDAVNEDSGWSFLLSVDENGDRKPTYNFTGGAEVAVKYILRKDRKKTKVIVY